MNENWIKIYHGDKDDPECELSVYEPLKENVIHIPKGGKCCLSHIQVDSPLIGIHLFGHFFKDGENEYCQYCAIENKLVRSVSAWEIMPKKKYESKEWKTEIDKFDFTPESFEKLPIEKQRTVLEFMSSMNQKYYMKMIGLDKE